MDLARIPAVKGRACWLLRLKPMTLAENNA